MKKTLTLIFSTLGIFISLTAQPTQYFMQRSLANVASCSEAQSLQLFLSGSHSLVGFEHAPKTVLLNICSPLHNILYEPQSRAEVRHFIGGDVSVQSYGVHNQLRMLLSYNYRFFVGENSNLTFGLGAGAHQNNSNYKRLENSQILRNREETSIATKFGARFESGRLNVSVFSYNKIFFAEIVWRSLQEDRFSDFEDLEGSEDKPWSAEVALLAIHNDEAKNDAVRISCNARYRNKLGVGVSYQTAKDWALNLNIQVSKCFQVGYAYKILNFSKIAPEHTIAIQYRILRLEDF